MGTEKNQAQIYKKKQVKCEFPLIYLFFVVFLLILKPF